MVVDWAGKLNPTALKQVQIELVHLEADYSYGYDDDSGESRYDRWLREVPEGKAVAKVEGGKFTFDVTPGDGYGGYLVRVKAGKARTDLVLDGEYSYDYYGYGDGNRVDGRRARRNRRSSSSISPGDQGRRSGDREDQDALQGQGAVDRRDRSRRDRRVARRHERRSELVVQARASSRRTSTSARSSSRIRTSSRRDAFMPDRAYGVKSARVTPTEFTQTVKLEAPREIRSSSPLTIKLDARRRAAGRRDRVGRRRRHPVADEFPDA